MTRKEIKDRKGTFKVSRTAMMAFPETIMQMMGKMLIVRAEYLMMTDEIEYQAFSPLFDKVSMACKAPEYDIYFKTSGKPEFDAKKKT